jgi:hypothetical protein
MLDTLYGLHADRLSQPGYRPIETEFLRRLGQIAEFSLTGYLAQALPHGGIAVSRGGQIRGVWIEDGFRLKWQALAPSGDVMHADTIDEALRKTMKLALMSLRVRRGRTWAVAA